MHFILMCNDEASVAADKYVTHGEGLSAAVTNVLRLGRVT